MNVPDLSSPRSWAYTCRVCGMRSRTKRDADECCARVTGAKVANYCILTGGQKLRIAPLGTCMSRPPYEVGPADNWQYPTREEVRRAPGPAWDWGVG